MELYADVDNQNPADWAAGLRAELLALPFQDDDGIVRGTVADHLAGAR